jgi:FkbM family methyltransferase
MGLMRFIGLKRLLPASVRGRFRDSWMRMLSRERLARERRLYRNFISPHDLVFDIGANVGEKTAVFLSLGARVVAVEPNPSCVDEIRKCCAEAIRDSRLTIEQVLATHDGRTMELTVFHDESAIASGSADFVNYARRSGAELAHKITAASTTLDQLIGRHGSPCFIKIDVEGMDAEVLQGLSTKPKFLTFEYHTAPTLLENALQCFLEVERLGFREANLTSMVESNLLYKDWMNLKEAISEIENLAQEGEHWGDVIVR